MFPLCFFTEARTQSQRKINKDSEVHGIRNLFTIFIKEPPTGGVATAFGNLYLSKLSKSVDESANANRQIFISCQLSSLQILWQPRGGVEVKDFLGGLWRGRWPSGFVNYGNYEQ